MQPSTPQAVVESLRQHHTKTPNLSIPVPRPKKSLDEQQQQRTEADYDGDQKDAIQLQDYRSGGDEKKDEMESPQVFVYDAANDRYVKESSPTPRA